MGETYADFQVRVCLLEVDYVLEPCLASLHVKLLIDSVNHIKLCKSVVDMSYHAGVRNKAAVVCDIGGNVPAVINAGFRCHYGLVDWRVYFHFNRF